jgi:O-antigen/teichoic acid export membrane protein
VLLTALVSAGVIHLIPWSLGATHGMAELAHYGYIATILNASNPVVFSVGSMVVPAVAAAAAVGGAAAGRRAAVRYILAGAAMLAPYYLLLLLAPGLVLRVFYGGNFNHAPLHDELRVFVLGYSLIYLGNVCVSVLNGLGRGHAGFVATAVAAAGAALVAVPMAVAFGVWGAAWGGIVPISAQLLVAAVLLRR